MLLQHPPTIAHHCPSCNHQVIFMLIGVQTWPVRVAERINQPEHIGLYNCPHCETSVSETELMRQQSA
jgi:hypothetical protein